MAVHPDRAALPDDTERQSARIPARELERFIPPEPHERFHIDAAAFPPDMHVQWLPYLIKGMPNPQASDYWRAGWAPARAADFPAFSGYGLAVPSVLKGVKLPDGTPLAKDIAADDPVIKDGQLLIVRPKEISRFAEERSAHRAQAQMSDHIRRVTAQSRAAIGDKNTRFRQFAARDEASTGKD